MPDRMRLLSKVLSEVLLTPQVILSLALIYQLSPTHWLSLILLCFISGSLIHRFVTTPVPVRDGSRWKVVIGGAGVSGLCMAKRLLDVGINDFVILEKSSGLGGTWKDNIYPGVACDVPSHVYTYSFFLNPWWSLAYSKGAEIWNYLEQFCSRFDLNKHIRYNQKVSTVVWHDDKSMWAVTTETGDKFEANFFVHATGGLHHPHKPTFKNQDLFKKPILHTAEWDPNIDLTGKKVAVIGTGASAIQLVPNIVDKVKELHLFQRTPAWVPPRRGYEYWTAVKYLFYWIPWTNVIYRYFFFIITDFFIFYAFFLTDSIVRPLSKWYMTWIMKKGLRKKPNLIEDLIPTFEPGCKRITPSDVYLKAIQQPNVSLIKESIEEFTADGIRTRDASVYEADIIVLATGYDIFASVGSYECVGKNKRRLQKEWGDCPTAYLGVTTPGCPNLFFLLGPSTALGHFSIIFMIECEVNYAIDCIRKLSDAKGGRSIEPKVSSLDKYVEWLKVNLEKTVFHSGCMAYYQNKSGFAWTLWPRSCTEYWWATYSCDENDYNIA